MSDYKELGVALKAYRVAAQETIEDVSGAVELEPEKLKEIEKGQLQPPLDIVGLLASHFSLRSSEAGRLFTLAGYDFNPRLQDLQDTTEPSAPAPSLDINVEIDNAVYSDGVQILSNKYGSILTFLQGADEAGEPSVISRIGMSREQAENLIKILKISLEKTSDEKQG